MKIKISDNVASVECPETLTAGSVGTIYADVEFTGTEWNGLNRQILFRTDGNEPIGTDLGDDNRCLVPWDVLDKPGCTLYAGARGYGEDGKVVKVSTWAKVQEISDGAGTGRMSAANLPADQYLETMKVARSIFETAGSIDAKLLQAEKIVRTANTLSDDAKASLVEYVRQYFRDGDTLTAEQINKIDTALAQLTTEVQQIKAQGGGTTEIWTGSDTPPDTAMIWLDPNAEAPDTPEIPVKTSQLKNDSGFLTKHQSLAEYAKKTDIPVIPAALPNPQPLTINGQNYDGSEAVDVNISGSGNGVTPELLLHVGLENVAKVDQDVDFKGHKNIMVILGGKKASGGVSVSGNLYRDGVIMALWYYTSFLDAANTSYPEGSIYQSVTWLDDGHVFGVYGKNTTAADPFGKTTQGSSSLNVSPKMYFGKSNGTTQAIDGVHLTFSAMLESVSITIYGY